jgi:hypothetical protein
VFCSGGHLSIGRKQRLLFWAISLVALCGINAQAVTIDSATVTPSSVDDSGQPLLPSLLNFGVSADSFVTLTIQNASSVVVRQLMTHQLQTKDSISTHTVTWDGLSDAVQPVPVGVYTFLFDATDANTSATATQRSVTLAVTSPAAPGGDPKKVFEDNSYMYPNPMRGGHGRFFYEAARPNATITLKIYTLSGDLVLSQALISGAAPGTTGRWPASGDWDVTNQSGKKLGRGLYYCVFREEDSQGTLQVTKKMAVIP